MKGKCEMNNLKISSLLKELGVPTNLCGYYYLRAAVEMMIKDISLVNAITTRLYPEIAGQFKATTARVERAMRHAIEVSMDRGNRKLLDKLFGYSIDANKGKPTNSEFITTVADYLCLLESESDS